MQDSQAQILEFCLKNAVFDGWSTKLLENASISAGLDKNHWRVLFPGGVTEIIAFFVANTDKKMESVSLEGLRTHEKVRELIKFRFTENAPHREAIKAALKTLALNPAENLRITYRTVDAIWRLAGDKATDWNFYSKRLLLAGVYGSTMLHWLNDKSENLDSTWKFLDNRLGEVGKLNKGISQIKDFFKKAI